MEVLFYNPGISTFLDEFSQPTWGHIYKILGFLKQYGHHLGLPQSRPLGKGLLELRVRGNHEVRIFYTFVSNKAVIVHAFIKKTQKTPNREIEIARKRISILTRI